MTLSKHWKRHKRITPKMVRDAWDKMLPTLCAHCNHPLVNHLKAIETEPFYMAKRCPCGCMRFKEKKEKRK